MSGDRDAWTAYAEKVGLMRSLQPVVTNTPKPNKYHAIRTIVEGITFASKKEAAYYAILKLRESAGEIKGLILQPTYPLIVKDIYIGRFTADFEYLELTGPARGELVTLDVKSPATKKGEAYRLRKKLVEALHDLTVTEI